MEKPARLRNKILAFLPKSASFSFQNPPFSPGRDKRSENLNRFKTHVGKGFSGPIISIVPIEVRRISKSSRFADEEDQEPNSPKVSCMGQIKHKKNKIHPPRKEKKPKRSSSIRNIFRGAKPGKKSDSLAKKPPLIPDRAPSLGQMKRFASHRDSFADFDWKANGPTDHRNYYSDEERGESDEEDEILIPHSAPLMVGGGMGLEQRKEVNLWKRRTMAPPRPLQLNGMGVKPL